MQEQAFLARLPFEVKGVPIEVARVLRATAPQTVQRITRQVQRKVPAFSGPTTGRRHDLILEAVDKAVTHFVDVVERKSSSEASLFRLIRQLGQSEAIEGRSLDALRAAHQVAARVAWEQIREIAKEEGTQPDVLSTLVDALFVFIDQLTNQLTLGHRAASPGLEDGRLHARRRLLKAMLSGQPPEKYAEHLKAADWVPPQRIAVVTGVLSLAISYANVPRFGPEVLTGFSRRRVTFVARPELTNHLSRRLINTPGIKSVATSWVMPVTKVRDASRWTCRALDLSARGLIDDRRIIDCAQHQSILLLHADPALSKHAGEELLAPLLNESPHRRVILAETMLLWLRARESAPVLAARLQIHHQTVRRRLHQLKDMFGDQLADPRQTLALLSALEVAVPMWREQNLSTSRRRTQP